VGLIALLEYQHEMADVEHEEHGLQVVMLLLRQ
jgi:hypothetical protein